MVNKCDSLPSVYDYIETDFHLAYVQLINSGLAMEAAAMARRFPPTAYLSTDGSKCYFVIENGKERGCKNKSGFAVEFVSGDNAYEISTAFGGNYSSAQDTFLKFLQQ